MSTLEVGQSVGRYRIERFLGAGAMGEVYLAEDPHIERLLAIKTLRLVGHAQHELDERKRRLLREARAAGKLLHPHVVTLFDAGEVEGLLYLAFEFVEGMDLAARALQSPPLTLSEVLAIVRQVAGALDYAHRQGIVHRDIKPSNILLDTAGRVKVADFGIAKMAGQSTELTMAGSVMGSPQYLSPEQIRGEELDGRSDVFSLGVVLYELLSSKRPFEGETITTLVYQILHKEPPPVSELRGGIPPRLEALLAGMLEKDRDQRLPGAAQVAEEIAAVERELPDETLSAPAAMAGTIGGQVPTRVLPRRTTVAAQMPTGVRQPPAPPIPPPPSPIVPPPPPGVLPSSAPAGAPASAAALPPMPAPGGRSAVPMIVLMAALLLAALAAGGWFAWTRLRPALAPEPAEQAADATLAAPSPGPGEQVPVVPSPEPPGPAPSTTTAPQSTPVVRPASPAETVPTPAPRQPPVAVPAAVPPALGTPGARDPRPGQSGSVQAAPPTPEPRPERRPDTRPPVPEQRPSAAPVVPTPTPAPPPPAAREPEERPARQIQADQRMKSGLELAFRITPPDAFVLLDGTNVGRASEWSGQKGARTYTLPGPGSYEVKIRKSGLRDHVIALEASDVSGTTPVSVRLRAKEAAEVETGDLEVVRVREGVTFRVKPADAEVLVDGEPRGAVRQFAGGLGRGFLRLPPGRHRLTLTAPGHRRHDLLVEVTAGAEEEREQVRVDLAPEGG